MELEPLDFESRNVPRSNGSRVSTEPYSTEGLERIKRLLENFEQSGEPKNYSILVDGETVVPKTSNADLFDTHSAFFNDLTKEVQVRLYHGNSPNCNTYKFIVSSQQSISGVQRDDRLDQALASQAKDMKILLLKDKVKRLKKKNIKLKSALEENSSVFKRSNMEGFKEYVGPVLGTIIQRFGNGQAPAQNQDGMGGVNQGAEVEMEPAIDAENLEMIQAMEEEYGAEQTKGIIKFIIRLARHEDLIGQVSEALQEREAGLKNKKQ